MNFDPLIIQAARHPRRLFLFDGVGAILSALLLGVVLVALEDCFGVPERALRILAVPPCFFAVYDFIAYCYPPGNLGLRLKGIALANLLYCALSLGMAAYHREAIQLLGWLYILGEVMIVSTLALLEWRVAEATR